MFGKHSLRGTAGLLLGFFLLAPWVSAQGPLRRTPSLSEDRFKNGAMTLLAFSPVAESTRDSVVKLSQEGEPVALGTIIDAGGLVLTKASEIKEGKLTCTLAGGKEVEAEVKATSEDEDLALVEIDAEGLKPIRWAPDEMFVGEWVITPGIESTPEAAGIVSVPPRRILPKRGIIGVTADTNSTLAMIGAVTRGLGADKAGLKPGDVVTAINGVEIKKWMDLYETLRQYRIGQTVKLVVQREDYEFEVEIVTVPEEMAFPELRARGRGRGNANRAEIMNRMGSELSRRADGFERAVQHDTVLQAWQCGGPLINLEGRAVGINIARAGRVASYALPTDLVRKLIDDLKSRAALPVKLQKAP